MDVGGNSINHIGYEHSLMYFGHSQLSILLNIGIINYFLYALHICPEKVILTVKQVRI